MNNSPINAKDMRVLTHQLGRRPRGAKAILRRCDKGFPQVVLNSPLLFSTTPFPTIYWLTCPLLNKKVAILEDQGWIKQFQEQMQEDICFREEFLKAQRAYLEKRKEMAAAFSCIPDKAEEVLTAVGIGGVRNLSAVKCLHAHYAHYLATGRNPVGKRVDELAGKIACNEECDST